MGMFAKTVYHCPRCNVQVFEGLADKAVYECPECRGHFRELVDEEGGHAVLIEEEGRAIPEPLYLPRGSIRAIATISMALSCWIMILAGQDVPATLFSLLLAILGYYFGFRTKMKSAQSRLIDATAEAVEPLYLPGGVIRTLLIAGFVITGVALYRRGAFAEGELKYLQFFVIIAGLVVGHVFGRLISKERGGTLTIGINHLKGLVVLGVCCVLFYLFVGGGHAQYPRGAMFLCAVVSFYFGSRS